MRSTLAVILTVLIVFFIPIVMGEYVEPILIVAAIMVSAATALFRALLDMLS